MQTARSAIFPAVIIGCLLVLWLGSQVTQSVAAPQQPNVQYNAYLYLNTIEQNNPTPTTPPPAELSSEITPASQEKPDKKKAQASNCQVSQQFPESVRQWCSLITKQARTNALEPNLIAALILQESGGDPKAYSRSGAVGLMQVMPRDGLAANFQCPNGPCFASRPTIAELQNPQFNVTYGTRMLASLISRYGSVREGLRAYGPAGMGYSYADLVISIWKRYQ